MLVHTLRGLLLRLCVENLLLRRRHVRCVGLHHLPLALVAVSVGGVLVARVVLGEDKILEVVHAGSWRRVQEISAGLRLVGEPLVSRLPNSSVHLARVFYLRVFGVKV